MEDMNGGPLQLEVEMQVSLQMEDRSNGGFDLFEVGAIHNQETYVDADWRRETRPKRIRPLSENNRVEKEHNKKLKMLDSASFDTSSHHTIDYLVE